MNQGVVGLRVPVLTITGSTLQPRLAGVREPLPLIVAADDQCSFELPFGEELENGSVWARGVSAGDNGAVTQVSLPRSCTQFSSAHKQASDHGCHHSDALENLRGFVNHHIERCSELVFPSDDDQSHAFRRTRSVARQPWGTAVETYWRRDTGDGPLRMIVRIAEECASLLKDVCLRPRRILQRVRQPLRLQNVQQIDHGSIRWLAARPGRTVGEKLGPRQRLVAVGRTLTADTPENRVVRDLLLRCQRECRMYLREFEARSCSPRYRAVERFGRLVRNLLRTSDIGGVPEISGQASPNYVLQFDPRYTPLWAWYDRLRRQQDLTRSAFRWRRRVFVEHLRLAASKSLSEFEASPRFAKWVYLRADHSCGFFIDPCSILSPWAMKSGDVLHLVSTAEIFHAVDVGAAPSWLRAVGADLIVMTDAGMPRALIYANLSICSADSECIRSEARRIARVIDTLGVSPKCSVVAVAGNAIASPADAMESQNGQTETGRHWMSAEIPILEGGWDGDLRTILRRCDIGDL